MSTVLSLNPHSPCNVLYGDAFGERDTLLGPSVSKKGGHRGLFSQEDCRSRALLGLRSCRGREDTSWASAARPTRTGSPDKCWTEANRFGLHWPWECRWVRHSTEDNLRFYWNSNAYILWSGNSILDTFIIQDILEVSMSEVTQCNTVGKSKRQPVIQMSIKRSINKLWYITHWNEKRYSPWTDTDLQDNILKEKTNQGAGECKTEYLSCLKIIIIQIGICCF